MIFRASLFFALYLSLTSWGVSAIVTIDNAESPPPNGGYALKDSSNNFLFNPGRIFIGGFSTFSTVSAIQNAFTSNFSGLAADFASIGDVTIEEDLLGGIDGIHQSTPSGLDPTSALGRDLAVWISSSGVLNDSSAEHLIYLTSQEIVADGAFNEATYDVLIRPASDGGNGTLAIGSDSTFTNDFGFGSGNQIVFNTVAVPEPSTITFLSLLFLFGIIYLRRQRRSQMQNG